MENIGIIANTILEFLISIKDGFRENQILSVGLLLIFGYFLSRLSEKFKLPAIGGYIFAGFILGDSLLGFIPVDAEYAFRIVIHIGIGILAIVIGREFRFAKLKQIGIKIIFITLTMILVTFTLVFLTFYFLKFELVYSIIIGIIACTTAPAVTLNVIKRLRVRGPLIDSIYSIVSISNAFTFLLYGIVISVISDVSTVKEFTFYSIIIYPIVSLLISICFGLISGLVLHLLLAKMKKLNEILILSLGLILLISTISFTLNLNLIIINLNLIIINLTFGITLINYSKKNERLFRVRVMYPLMPPIYSLFYAISAISLNVKSLLDVNTLLGILLYIVIRMIGKFTGIFIGANIIKAEKNVKKYLGFCVFPQAGVAVSLVIMLHILPNLMCSHSETIYQITNIILISIFINQLLGRVISRQAIIRGVDIDVE